MSGDERRILEKSFSPLFIFCWGKMDYFTATHRNGNLFFIQVNIQFCSAQKI